MTSIKYKIKDTYFISNYNNKVQIGDEPGFCFEIEDESGFFVDFVQLLNGKNSVDDIKEILLNKYPEITEEYILDMIYELDKNSLIKVHDDVSDENIEARHVSNLNFFDNFSNLETNSYDLLSRLKTLRVGIVGLGGLGSNLLTQLVGIGCETIYVIEPDIVEEKNLNRQFLYRTNDIGKSKAKAAKDNIHMLNPKVSVITKNLKITSVQDLLSHLPEEIDLLICAADQPLLNIQLWCNQYCLMKNIPLISGGLGCTQGHFLTVIPNSTACLECFYHGLVKNDDIKNTVKQLMNFKNKNAAIANSITLIASSIMTEIIRMFALKIDPVSRGRRVFIDFLHLNYIPEDTWKKTEYCNCNKTNLLPQKTVLEDIAGDLVEA
ncbi:ThiF family adenylyltransferase [Mangrovibacillus cuniculi]|uniref:ThiF family adenylyltransferase n=1 Tax=Mangrovibacillus cuniculi TaxID=2593652 RepID=A0A7S8CDZ3_9BACI|nr:ThiF family adenylyltransferase [Mangrovibacillus cuniculi]QPC48220.1 ThiF family adenylyltransferase [Mangrovibacillus cuniculi]